MNLGLFTYLGLNPVQLPQDYLMAEKISKGSKVIFWNREPIVKRRADLDFTVLFTVLFGYFWLSEGVFMCVCAGGGGGGGGGVHSTSVISGLGRVCVVVVGRIITEWWWRWGSVIIQRLEETHNLLTRLNPMTFDVCVCSINFLTKIKSESHWRKKERICDDIFVAAPKSDWLKKIQELKSCLNYH